MMIHYQSGTTLITYLKTRTMNKYRETLQTESEGKTDKGWVALFDSEEEYVAYLKWRLKNALANSTEMERAEEFKDLPTGSMYLEEELNKISYAKYKTDYKYIGLDSCKVDILETYLQSIIPKEPKI